MLEALLGIQLLVAVGRQGAVGLLGCLAQCAAHQPIAHLPRAQLLGLLPALVREGRVLCRAAGELQGGSPLRLRAAAHLGGRGLGVLESRLRQRLHRLLAHAPLESLGTCRKLFGQDLGIAGRGQGPAQLLETIAELVGGFAVQERSRGLEQPAQGPRGDPQLMQGVRQAQPRLQVPQLQGRGLLSQHRLQDVDARGLTARRHGLAVLRLALLARGLLGRLRRFLGAGLGLRGLAVVVDLDQLILPDDPAEQLRHCGRQALRCAAQPRDLHGPVVVALGDAQQPAALGVRAAAQGDAAAAQCAVVGVVEDGTGHLLSGCRRRQRKALDLRAPPPRQADRARFGGLCGGHVGPLGREPVTNRSLIGEWFRSYRRGGPDSWGR